MRCDMYLLTMIARVSPACQAPLGRRNNDDGFRGPSRNLPPNFLTVEEIKRSTQIFKTTFSFALVASRSLLYS